MEEFILPIEFRCDSIIYHHFLPGDLLLVPIATEEFVKAFMKEAPRL